ncbi:tyrosine recombinase XerA [Desulfotomaculum defluvii]
MTKPLRLLTNNTITFQEAINKFLEELETQGKSNLTVTNYRVDLNKFVEWLGRHDPHTTPATPGEIGRVVIKDYAQFLKTSGEFAPATANRRIISLRAFFKYLTDKGVITSNPTTDVKTKSIQAQNEVKWLTRPEVSKLFHAIETAPREGKEKKARDKAILSILVNCGLRVSELANLRTADVDLDNGILTVFSGKGNKFRKVPLGKATVKAVNEYLEQRKDAETDYLFTSKRSPKLTDRAVQHLFERISKTVGFEVTPHMCRHTFCKQIADKTGKLEVVADLAGHSNIETSRRYVTPSMKELKKAVEDVEFEA